MRTGLIFTQVNVMSKIFDLPYDSQLSTPAGEFVQLIVTVFKNLDTLLPAIYDGIIPKAIETLFATIFIAYAYHWICVIQPVVFALYTYLAYVGAKDKAKRNADMMNAMMSEWGDILGAAGSYERAHICGNVPYELGRVRHSFERIGLKVSDVEMGEQLCGNQIPRHRRDISTQASKTRRSGSASSRWR